VTEQRNNTPPNLTLLLGATVSLLTIVGTILGVGWKLGSIASGIETQIVEVKGEMRTLNAISGERINAIERRLSEIERSIKETTR
jgi:hypothetical protein